MPEWMNSLAVPILCGAPLILAVLFLLRWLTSRKGHEPDPQYPPEADTVHNLYDPDERNKIATLDRKLTEHYYGQRHDNRARTLVVNGSPSDLNHVPFDTALHAQALITENDYRARLRFTQLERPGEPFYMLKGKRKNG